jgi:ubiquitin-activating enzyme E1
MEEKEELYSRQIAAFGSNSMNKISKLKILIYGLRGLGIEISKNIILAGPEKVTIFDDNKITNEDLCSNFYIEEKDISFRRDEICLKKLSELNNLVKCDYLKDGNLEEHIKEYDLLIITEIMEIENIIKLNKICHENKKGFIYSLIFGLSFYCFVDFGEHVINNLNNNDARKYFIKNIKKGKNTIIIIDNEFDDFALNEDDYVIFKEIKGINQLLDGKKRKVKNCEDNKFEIEEDSSNYEDYIRGGVVEEIVENIIIKNKQIEEMLNFPEQCENVNQKNKELNLHLAFLSLHEYYKQTKKLPENNKNDLARVFELTKYIYKKNQNEWSKYLNLEEDFLSDIYKFSKCEISPVCGYGGGVVSQEIIKYIGIYKPINQWFRAEFISILDKEANHEIISKGTRYNDQILIFGDETQKKLENLNVFMIGAGALGCELLKYCAMMGISTNPNSLLTVTDHDRIEKSNLSRQFLFRENNLGDLKSQCAINAVKKMNNKINCVSMQEFVHDKTEKIFDKTFFEKQNAVIIAVDNFEARTYISGQCEKYNITYFNCGTDGPYANVEAYIPGKTVQASYPVNYKKVVPPCTLKMFPCSINHCILWALDHFEKFFNKNIINIKNMNNDINKFYEDMNKILDLRTQFHQIKKLFKFLKIAISKSFDKCIKYSIKKYHSFFINKINNILKLYPPDYINKETNLKFWTGNKIMPHPLIFDINEEMCFEFVKSFSILLANCLGIELKNVNVSEYIKEYSKQIEIKPKKMKTYENKSYYESKIKEIKKIIEKYLSEKHCKINFKPIQYEKDTNDINQINYISYTSNLRAKNYNINNLDKMKIKIIAGKIMPALITSTSSVAGLLALQLYVICQNSNCKTFRIGIMDLSDNTLGLGIPELIK